LNSIKTVIKPEGLFNNPVFSEADNLPTLDGICEAHRLLPECVKNTPLVRSEALSLLFKAEVWIKNETLSPIASFKTRGALADLIRCNRQKRISGAVTSSSGNHGQGVAYAARWHGVPAHIFLPEKPNPFKRRRIEMLGAAIHECGDDIDDAKQAARSFARRSDYLLVDDGESLNVMEGAGTVGLEIAQALKNIDGVFIPMGSGSLASGSAAAIKSLQGRAKVIAVQSDGSPAMAHSFRARRAIPHSINTIADGLVCRQPSLLALKGLLAFVDEAGLVSDEELVEGVSVLGQVGHILVEPSGAAGFAGAWKRRQELAGKRIVLVLTGAGAASDSLPDA
jgi:threonine dehydratase